MEILALMLSCVLSATAVLHAGGDGRRQRLLDERSNVAGQLPRAKKAREGTLPQGLNGLAAKYPGDAGIVPRGNDRFGGTLEPEPSNDMTAILKR